MTWPAALTHLPPVQAAAFHAEQIRRVALGEKFASTGHCSMQRVCAEGQLDLRFVEFSTADKGCQALLVPYRNGRLELLVDRHGGSSNSDFNVWTQAQIGRRRARFRAAHEVAHSLFYTRKTPPPRRTILHSAAEETFCNAFARHLLVPSQALVGREGSGAELRRISEEYDVSVMTAATALVQANPDLIVLGVGAVPELPSYGRVAWAAAQHFVPRNMRVPSSAVRHAASSGHAASIETLNRPGLSGRFAIDASKHQFGRQLLVVLRSLAVKSQ